MTCGPGEVVSPGCLMVRFRRWLAVFAWLSLWVAGMGLSFAQTEDVPQEAGLHFEVDRYVVEDNGLMPTNVWMPILARYTGPNVSLAEIANAATELQAEYSKEGHPQTSIAIAQEEIANGVVTLNVFQTAIPQVLVSGVRYSSPTTTSMATNLPAMAPVAAPPVAATTNAVTTNVVETTAAPLPPPEPVKPITPEQMVEAKAELLREMARLDAVAAEPPDNRIHVISTNAGPHFDVEHYVVLGNSVLTPQTIAATLTNIDGDFGTNVSFDGVKTAVEQLHEAYYARGYVTVAVRLPPQKLTNATVKVQVTEGRLAAIKVEGNYYYSSNNVMRALPSLHTNMILNNYVFQRELDVANASRDRTIYPVVGPGPEPGTTALTLRVKDRFPLHARTEINNSYTPGTPDLRVSSTAQYDNLWDREHQVGLQYNFSPNGWKNSGPYNLSVGTEPLIDAPEIDNYSVYYRIPLGGYSSVQQQLDQNPSSFGYSEVNHKFSLPPATGRPELTIYASRATTDTGVQLSGITPIILTNNVEVGSQTGEENVTLNEGFGGKLTLPLPASQNIMSVFSLGFDFKHYESRSASANIFLEVLTTTNNSQPIKYGQAIATVKTPISSIILNYLPFNLGWNGNVTDKYGVTALNAQANFNILAGLSDSEKFAAAAGNPKVKAQYATFQAGVTRDQGIYHGWGMILHADGQKATGPLFNNEQYGIGGTASVRGYLDGQDYGDDGWRISLEPHTPPTIIGMVNGDLPFSVRGSVFLDDGEVIRLDNPTGSYYHHFLGAGFGVTANIGSHWDGRLTLAWPLLHDGGTPGDSVHVYFGVGGQF